MRASIRNCLQKNHHFAGQSFDELLVRRNFSQTMKFEKNRGVAQFQRTFNIENKTKTANLSAPTEKECTSLCNSMYNFNEAERFFKLPSWTPLSCRDCSEAVLRVFIHKSEAFDAENGCTTYFDDLVADPNTHRSAAPSASMSFI